MFANFDMFDEFVKGYKNTLYEGGTLTPSFMYSTKKQFPKNRVNSIFHIIDWFPTILDLAGFQIKNLENLDGVSQTVTFRNKFTQKPRTSFIYGLLNEFLEDEKGIFRF